MLLFCLSMMKNQNSDPTRKVSVLNPATSEEMIIHFRIVNRDLTPLIGLNDSEILQLIELLRENIALVAPGNPSVALTAS